MIIHFPSSFHGFLDRILSYSLYTGERSLFVHNFAKETMKNTDPENQLFHVKYIEYPLLTYSDLNV